ncbi:uncharacterized protein PV06_11183 [Exophiala oligosperma]|uniref:Uncharacterized protein n=1 Tax=Exophiala oligosperma TaxID=215243 RepID=A0A0D2A8E9_9EURO|nr:uncharacterized protein PV06_11183 [Exophiala oligosperma]KIW36596.1 hypothetical protein PV06_11183 [Exophiala oligosperma]
MLRQNNAIHIANTNDLLLSGWFASTSMNLGNCCARLPCICLSLLGAAGINPHTVRVLFALVFRFVTTVAAIARSNILTISQIPFTWVLHTNTLVGATGAATMVRATAAFDDSSSY